MLKAVLSRKDLSENEGYFHLVRDLLADKNVLRLAQFSHHSGTTRLQHSLNVSYYNYKLCHLLHLDERAGARAGLLHDLFFYDRREHTPVEGEGWHGVGHPKIAFFNASELFELSQVEGDMIANHMWPLTPRLPRYRETYVITLVDKFCACAEVISHFLSLAVKSFHFAGQKLRGAEVFALMLLIRLTLR